MLHPGRHFHKTEWMEHHNYYYRDRSSVVVLVVHHIHQHPSTCSFLHPSVVPCRTDLRMMVVVVVASWVVVVVQPDYHMVMVVAGERMINRQKIDQMGSAWWTMKQLILHYFLQTTNTDVYMVVTKITFVVITAINPFTEYV
jgi:hypothetical protein